MNCSSLHSFEYFCTAQDYNEAKDIAEKQMETLAYESFAILRKKEDAERKIMYAVYLKAKK